MTEFLLCRAPFSIHRVHTSRCETSGVVFIGASRCETPGTLLLPSRDTLCYVRWFVLWPGDFGPWVIEL
jgi:hypothetical protein